MRLLHRFYIEPVTIKLHRHLLYSAGDDVSATHFILNPRLLLPPGDLEHLQELVLVSCLEDFVSYAKRLHRGCILLRSE